MSEKVIKICCGFNQFLNSILIPKMEDPNNKDAKIVTESVVASVLIAWPFITSIVHFQNVEGFDFPNPFDLNFGFDIEN